MYKMITLQRASQSRREETEKKYNIKIVFLCRLLKIYASTTYIYMYKSTNTRTPISNSSSTFPRFIGF